MRKISIIIPTYNEAANIQKIILALNDVRKENGLDMEIVVIDDSSPDGTAEIAKEIISDYDKVIVRSGTRGLSLAVVTAMAQINSNIIGVMDADFSHPPDLIPKLIGPILDNRAELTIASRYIKGGGIKNWSLQRRIISKVACLLVGGVTSVKDATSGFFFMHRNIIDGIDINTRGFKIGLEVFVKGKYKNFLEIPYIFVNREKGRSKLSLKPISEYLIQLAKLYNLKTRGYLYYH